MRTFYRKIIDENESDRKSQSRKLNKKGDSKRELDDALKRKLKDEDDVPERLFETPDRNPLLRSQATNLFQWILDQVNTNNMNKSEK